MKSFEIERKWLIDLNKIPYDLDKAVKTSIEQSYINFEPVIRVRKINNGYVYILTIKTGTGIKREEYEFEITKEGYESLIVKKEGNTIFKDRYTLKDGENKVEIDVFKGNLEGLSYMEIEFDSEEKANAFETPDWVIKDVSEESGYKNAHLARFGMPR